MSKFTKRHNVSLGIRRGVIERDGNACRKCGRCTDLQVHHINAVICGGTNDANNLITLCGGCHREFEHLMTAKVDFYGWLLLPRISVIIRMLLTPDIWVEDINARQIRDAFSQANAMYLAIEENGRRDNE